MLLLDFSQQYLENIKILPFVASILVVIFTALITIQITKKKFAGIIAILVLLQSFTFLEFDTIAVYENFWVLFYLISLYTIQRRWPLSSISFILAVFTKAFVVTYFFMNIYWIFRAEISKRKSMLTVSLGSGNGGDVNYLFMCDICGENEVAPRLIIKLEITSMLYKKEDDIPTDISDMNPDSSGKIFSESLQLFQSLQLQLEYGYIAKSQLI